MANKTEIKKPFVAVLMGSESDASTMGITFKELKALKIPFEARILSAHRTPEDTVNYVKDADQRGCAVFIAAAGLAAHLAGTVAAHTIKPVIGVPMPSGYLQGLDALLSTVQMPGGVPVASMGIGETGAKNAAILAAQIIALHDESVRQNILRQRKNKRDALKKADADFQR